MFASHKPKAAPTPGPQSQQRAAAVRPGETSQIFASLPPIQTHQRCFPTASRAVPSSLPLTLFCLSSSLMKMTWKSHWSWPSLNKHTSLQPDLTCEPALTILLRENTEVVFSRNKLRPLLRVQNLGPICTLVPPPISLHLTHSQGWHGIASGALCRQPVLYLPQHCQSQSFKIQFGGQLFKKLPWPSRLA